MQINPSKNARRKVANFAFVAACVIASVLALGVLSIIMYSLFKQGFSGLNVDVFLLETPAPGSHGGLANAILGSLQMCGLGMLMAVIIGVLAGTWLAEIGGDSYYGKFIRFLNDVLLSAPSILIGLFVYELLVRPFGGFSGWAGAVALAMLATPIVIRTTEDILNLQPNALREAGMALGASQWVTVKDIIWKAAGAGLLTGGLLGFARISGETAPLLFTALNNQFFSEMGDPMSSLPVIMFNYALSPYDDWKSLAWAGALLVALTVLSVNIIGRFLASQVNKN